MIIYCPTTFKFLPVALICLLGWLLSCPLTLSKHSGTKWGVLNYQSLQIWFNTLCFPPLYFFGFRIILGGFWMLLPDQCSEVPEHLQ